MNRQIRVMIVDDHDIVREGLAAVISTASDIILAGSLGSGKAALDEVVAHAPDVVLLDLRMPDMDGIATCKELQARCPNLRILILSSHAGDEAITRAFAAGAVGYVLKSMAVKDLLESIRAANAGRVAPHPAVAEQLAQRVFFEPLSPREQEVLRHVAQGQSNKEVAAKLGLSESTVKNHVNSILTKLHASDRTQAVTIAVQRGIIDLGM